MDPQTVQSLIVALIVAGAALFMGLRVYRTISTSRARKKAGGCGGGCCD
ncbi:MAG TPA: hypothetical protein VF167_12135 [Longimicrobiaceae bacterium]